MFNIKAISSVTADIANNRVIDRTTSFEITADEPELHVAFHHNGEFTVTAISCYLQTVVAGIAGAIWYADDKNIASKQDLLTSVIEDLTQRLLHMKVSNIHTQIKPILPERPSSN